MEIALLLPTQGRTHLLEKAMSVLSITLESVKSGVEAGGVSTPGNYREENQDRIHIEAEFGLHLIADGMGGYTGGAAAAELAIREIAEQIVPCLAFGNTDADCIEEALTDGIQNAQRAMWKHIVHNPDCRQMGTTFAGLIIQNRTAYFFRVGDCRLSRSRLGKTAALTRDESLVELLVQCGEIAPSEAQTHPKRHIVVNSLLADEIDCLPTVQAIRIRKGDRFVITTDGVTDALNESQIQTVLDTEASPKDAAHLMVETSLEFGSKDNVSCIVVDVQ